MKSNLYTRTSNGVSSMAGIVVMSVLYRGSKGDKKVEVRWTAVIVSFSSKEYNVMVSICLRNGGGAS